MPPPNFFYYIHIIESIWYLYDIRKKLGGPMSVQNIWLLQNFFPGKNDHGESPSVQTYCSNIGDTTLMSIAENCSNLENLRVHGCPDVTIAGVTEIGNKCVRLTSVSLGFELNSSGAELLKELFPQVTWTWWLKQQFSRAWGRWCWGGRFQWYRSNSREIVSTL